MKRFLIGILVCSVILEALVEAELYYLVIVISVLLVSLSAAYLVSSKAREFVNLLLRVKKATPLKRWCGAIFVICVGVISIASVYREQASKQKTRDAQSEIQLLIQSAQSSIAKKDVEQAIKYLRKAISVQGAPNEDKDKAWSLFQQCKDAISDYKVSQVLNGMTEEQFAAFKRRGTPPVKTFFADLNLNEVFLENLKKNRSRAEELRNAERTRLRVEAETRQVEEERKQAQQALAQGKERVRAETDEQRKRCEQEPNRFVTKEGYMAGVTYEAFMKSQELLAQKDQAALAQLIAAGLVGPLKPGVCVYLVETRQHRVPILGIMVTDTVKIRPEGTLSELWTNVEAVGRD